MTKKDIRDCKTCIYGQKVNVTVEVGDVTEHRDVGSYVYYHTVKDGYVCSLGHNQNINSKLDVVTYHEESDLYYPECTLYSAKNGLMHMSTVIDLLKDLYAHIDNQPENKDDIYNGILDGIMTDVIEELELKLHRLEDGLE